MSEIDFVVYGLFGCCTFIKDFSDWCCVQNIEDKKKRTQTKESKDYDYKYFNIVEDMER